MKNRPVVLVHGWNSDTGSMQGTEAGLEKRLNGGNAKNKMLFLRFGYAPYSAEWPSNANVSQCLGDYILAASAAYKAGGGDGKVLAVGHSMGGIAIRFASARPGVDKALGGVVTLGTPHAGSPWGATPFSTVIENTGSKLKGFRMPVPANGTSGGDCLAEPARRSKSCAQIPYLPQGIPISTIGTQITINRELFNLPLVKGPTASISLFGDGIVPEESANAYRGTGSSTDIGYDVKQDPRRIGCTYDTAYLWSVLPTAQGQAFLDLASLSALKSGTASPALAELTAYAYLTPCFHTNLTSNPQVLDPTAIALRNYDKTLQAKSVPILGGPFAPDQEGYGTVRPPNVFNGGSPSGRISDITWSTWGQREAVGNGMGWYQGPEDPDVASGSSEPARIVAWDLGKCQGKYAYRKVTWYFPQFGETLVRENTYDLCSYDY